MSQLSSGTTLGQYQIVGQIGTGGMATVFKAHHTRLERDVAIKVMHSMFLTDQNFVARFEREARVVARLDHPNIVQVYDYDLYNGQPYLVMKLIEGRTLKDVLNNGALPLPEILRIMPAVADALTYAHSQGVLHRDVKPSNIIIDQNNTPYLTDFGLARIAKAGESTMSADMLLGTPYYISPEQAQGGIEIDARADVYSLGVVLYELVVGRVPFTGDTPYIIVHKHIYETAVMPSTLNPEIPPAVEYVLMKALSKDPADRYPTPNALSAAFADAVRESGLAALDSSRIERAAAVHIPRDTQQQVSPLYRKDTQGNIVTIPAPAAPQAPPTETIGIQGFSRIFSAEGVRDMSDRVREAMVDIRDQFENRENFRQLRNDAEKAFVEIRTKVENAVEESGGEFSFEFNAGDKPHTSKGSRGNQAGKSGGDTSARRTSRVIQREWSTEDRAVRLRVNERLKRRRDLIGHIVIYLLSITMIAALRGPLQAMILEIFGEDSPLIYLRDIHLPLVVALLWGGGIVSHLLKVFYQTGSRLDRRRTAIYDAMVDRYGENWLDVASDKEYKKVRARVNKPYDSRLGFFSHFFSAITVIAAVFTAWGAGLQPMLLDMFGDNPDARIFFQGMGAPVLFTVLMLVAVAIHGLVVFAGAMTGDDATEREIQREMERERSFAARTTSQTSKPKPDLKAKNDALAVPPAVRLSEDGEFTESLAESLDDPATRRR